MSTENKIVCECQGQYLLRNKKQHETTKKHLEFIRKNNPDLVPLVEIGVKGKKQVVDEEIPLEEFIEESLEFILNDVQVVLKSLEDIKSSQKEILELLKKSN